MPWQSLKIQASELIGRQLERLGMTHQELAMRINQAREGAGRQTVDPDALAYRLEHPDIRTGIQSSVIEEACAALGVLPVLLAVSIRQDTRGAGAVPDERQLSLLRLCDDDDITYRSSVDDPDMNLLMSAGLVDISGADHVGWYATEAGRQLLVATRPVGVCECCWKIVMPGDGPCPCDIGVLTERPCLICRHLVPTPMGCKKNHDPESPPEGCSDWEPDQDAYQRKRFEISISVLAAENTSLREILMGIVDRDAASPAGPDRAGVDAERGAVHQDHSPPGRAKPSPDS